MTLALVVTLPACGGGGGGGGGSSGGGGGGIFSPPIGNYTRTNPNYGVEATSNYGLAAIGATVAQTAGWTGQGIKVGVVDTGIDLQHPDFTGAIDGGSYDLNSSTRAGVDDVGGHGTMVAGVIAARRDGFDAQGVAPKSTILAVRAEIPGSCNPRCSFTYESLAAATNYAAVNNARIINYSLGGGSDPNGTFTQALRDAAARDIVLISAAGNDAAADPSFPASFAGSADARGLAIAVGAVDQSNILAGFSNKAGTAANYFLVAPGVGIYTTQNGGGTTTASGTSFAAPHVAGAAALLMEASPFLTSQQIVQLLLTTATDLGAPGTDATYGRGLVNLDSALQPQGTLVVPTGQTVASGGAPLSSSSMHLGSAFGDALSTSDALKGAIFLDSYGRPFTTDLTGRVSHAAPLSPIESWLAPAEASDAVSLPGNGGLVRYGLNQGPDHGVVDNPGGERGARKRGMASLSLANGTSVSLGTGFGLGGQFGLTGSERSGGATMPAMSRTITPFLDMAGDGPAASLGQDLGNGLTLTLGLSQGIPGETTAGLPPVARRAMLAELSKSFGSGAMMGLNVGSLTEKGALLETYADGAFRMNDAAQTRFASTFGSMPLAEGLDLFGSWSLGLAEGGNLGPGLLAGAQGLTAQSFRFGVAKDNLASDGDQFMLAVARPLLITGGTALFDVPVGRTPQGDIVYERRAVGLTPSGNETDLELGYRFALDGGHELLWSGLIQFQPGHVRDAAPDYGTGLRYRLVF